MRMFLCAFACQYIRRTALTSALFALACALYSISSVASLLSESMRREAPSSEFMTNMEMAMPRAKSSPMLFVPCPRGAIASMGVSLGLLRGGTRRAPAPQAVALFVPVPSRIAEPSV
jgi:hypothetical protein